MSTDDNICSAEKGVFLFIDIFIRQEQTYHITEDVCSNLHSGTMHYFVKV